jgi:methylisocitrate lyase
MTTRTTLHSLLATGDPVAGPGVWDVLSATLAARAGCRTIFLSGYCLSATRLGEPDIGLLTATEVVDTARRIARVVDIPLIVDIDTGYGNPFNVERTVGELLQAGAAGCFLEDQVWPKRCGHMRGKRVVPLEDYLPKLRAALRLAEGSGFHVTARTDARAVDGLDEAIRRARAFADAGAHAVFVEAPASIDEMATIRAAIPASVVLVANMVEGGRTPLQTVAALGQAGYRLIVFPVAGLLAQTRATRAVYEALTRDGTTTAEADRMLTFDAMNTLLGLDERYQREAEFQR